MSRRFALLAFLSVAVQLALSGVDVPRASAKKEKVTPTGVVHEVTITNFVYEPANLEVNLGDTIVWKNKDIVPHTSTADDHAFDTRKIGPRKSKKLVMSKQGTFPYFCLYHKAMRATVTVH